MYQPPHFREDRLDVQHDLIRSHPLGLLITSGPGGLMANPIPFLIDAAASERGTLLCHMARANPQWRELAAVPECLVVFQGPQDYVTPSWYATKRETGKVVPTWNYATVHAWGKPAVIDDADWLRRQIESLTQAREDQGRSRGRLTTRPPLSWRRRSRASSASRSRSAGSRASGRSARTVPNPTGPESPPATGSREPGSHGRTRRDGTGKAGVES